MHDIRQNKNHIVIIDGTLSRLDRGYETHCGKLYKCAMKTDGARRKVYYDRGVQGKGFYKWINVATGRGLNKSVIRSYQKLSESYRQGDKIFLFGYSRGAYAIRLLAGIIERMGLLKPEYATRSLAEQAFILYNCDVHPDVLNGFKTKYNSQNIGVDFLGVWDTVKALGLPIPLLHRYTPLGANFKDHALPSNVKFGCHAIAYHEDRHVYRPELWRSRAPNSELKQVIFAGTHSIVGGQSHHIPYACELSAFSFHWMMEEALAIGLELPNDWGKRYPTGIDKNLKIKDIHNRGFWRRERRRFYPVEIFKDHHSLTAFQNLNNH